MESGQALWCSVFDGSVLKVDHSKDCIVRGVQTNGRNERWVQGLREGVKRIAVDVNAGVSEANATELTAAHYGRARQVRVGRCLEFHDG